MGGLALPEHGAVYLDANSIIYSVERIEPYRTVLFVTNDSAFRRIPGLPVALLSEALSPEEGSSLS